VEYEDRLTIATPEGLELSLQLAGAASRFVAASVDLAIQLALLIAVGVVAAVVGGGGVVVAVYLILVFLIIFGYDVAFEVLNAGRTPGKQLNGLRVVRVSGHPVTFLPSCIRNVIRPIDFLPGWYLLGATVILATSKNQRIGDIVAGTLVIRQRGVRKQVPLPSVRPPVPATVAEAVWDTSRITPDEVATVAQFLERRASIDDSARSQLARTLASRLQPKVTGVPPGLYPEQFLERLVSLRRRSAS